MKERSFTIPGGRKIGTLMRNHGLCVFCGSTRRHAYFLNGYDLQYCRSCGTIGVLDPPDEVFLRDFYQGFSFQTSVSNLDRVRTPQMREWMARLLTSGCGTMLDFGGGADFLPKHSRNLI